MRYFSLATTAIVLAVSLVRAQTNPAISRETLPAEITYPEGVAYDAERNAIFTGSAATGAVVRIDLAKHEPAIVAAAGATLPAEPFPALLGMKLDSAKRLWLAGGRTGRLAVIDSSSGKLLKKFAVPDPTKSLINDIAIVGPNANSTAAYFTDTLAPTLWRVTTTGDQIGELEPWLEFTDTVLKYDKGANLNGIAATPDGLHLIVVQMNKGLLFRIDVADKRIVPIDFGGVALSGADGLVLDGRKLYVVRQTENEIVTIELSEDLAKGREVGRYKGEALAWPATGVVVGDRLLVVNTQFNKRSTNDPERPFAIVGIPLAVLKNKP